MLNFLLAYFLCGTLTGTLSGLLGIGGGIIGVPILLMLFSQQNLPEASAIHMAIATFLATIIPTTLVAGYRHWKNQLIDFSIVKKMLPGLLIGCVFGTFISSHLHPDLLRKIFSLFICVAALQMMGIKQERLFPVLLNQKILFPITIFIGGLCSLLGLGGGILMVPYLCYSGISTKQAIAISTTCILPLAILGTLLYSFIGMQFTDSISNQFIYWPAFFSISLASIIFAPIGANLMAKLPIHFINRCFAFLLLFVAIKLFL